ncbi:hypothetical protein EOE67_10850 [Rheinheimera riviphila]|uniref:Uncharacterized protein n=1 Tax=Rheinheimera riviphila TaxID=1834037 RepID=A0A437QS88_9GAMM|nr:hypothetical protein [Rheinheimera riviphila]RVU37371.1 hypothetical protein EOE67_10850 [Rheinheimera riviphila]
MLFFIEPVFAAELDQVLICKSCQSADSFKQFAKGVNNPEVTNVLVINLETRQAKAFRIDRVFFGYGPSAGFHNIPVDMPLPTDAISAIEGYHDLNAAFVIIN